MNPVGDVFEPMSVRSKMSTELARTMRFHSHITITDTTVEMRSFPVFGPSHKVTERRMTVQHAPM